MDIWLFLGIFVILDLFLLTVAVVSRSRGRLSEQDIKRFRKIWVNIGKMDERHAIMEADKLLYEVLDKRGYRGTLGEKLKKAGPAFTNLNDVWSAHKMRNKLAHELGFNLRPGEAASALEKFKRAYKDFGLKL